jgi:hypothetical protein
MKMPRFLACLLLLPLALLTSCGKKSDTATGPAAPAKIKLGFLVKQPEEPWFQYEWKGADKAAAQYGFELIKIGVPDGEKTLAAIDSLAANGAQGFVICTPDVRLGPAIVAKAKAAGLSHLYVRTGSSWNGFYAGDFLDKILPAAHEADLMVYGWDFPRLIDVEEDVRRAKAAIDHRAPGKHRIDGFSADIETQSEGTRITAAAAAEYGRRLRAEVGSSFPLIATVPRPSPAQNYPYAEVVESFDAIAPMVYWLNRQPDTDVAGALRDLARFNKPVFPVGQAYDGAPEGGRAGVPPPEELWRFMRFAQAGGAQGVSFWSWQAANAKAWAAITEAEEFRAPAPWQE